METLALDTPQVFDFQTHAVRVLGTPDVPWFVAADVCAALGIQNTTDALLALDLDQKNTLGISEGIRGRGNPNVNVIDESGLYTLIFRSNKPEARAFRRWVTSEVLPTIRKTGQYAASNYPPSNRQLFPDSSISPTSYLFLATTIEVFLTEKPSWTGTISELLHHTTDLLQEGEQAQGEQTDWPCNSVWMGRRLRESRPWLQSLGLDFTLCDSRFKDRTLVLYRIAPVPLPPQPLALPGKPRQRALSQLVIEQALEIQRLKGLLAQRE